MKISALFLSLASAISIFFGPPAPAADPNPKDIPNFAIVEKGVLYRGGRPNDKGMLRLKAEGVKTVISLQAGDAVEENFGGWVMGVFTPGERESGVPLERHSAKLAGLKYVWEPMSAVLVFDHEITDREEDIIDQTLKIMNNPNLQPVYIHCGLGQDRTGLLAALYRVQHGWSVEKAHEEWISSGHNGLNGFLTESMDSFYYRKARKLSQH